MKRLDTFIDLLHNSGLEADAEELADVLWLALRLPYFQGAPTPKTSREETPHRETTKRRESPHPVTTETAKETQGTRPESTQDLHTIPPRRSKTPVPETTTKTPAKGRPFRTPAMPMLPETLRLGRALRPLMRRIPSRIRQALDEAETVHQIAERQLWVPVFKGAPERWLELALVADASSSMDFWEPTLMELRCLLERHGAFRDVRLWRMSVTDGALTLYKGTVNSQPRHPRELLEHSGRRVVWILSDFVASWWRQGKPLPWLRLWSSRQPLALVHMLPQRFWQRSALGATVPINVRATKAASTNPRLYSNFPCLPVGQGDEAPIPCRTTALKLPVLTLEPESVGYWASLLAGRSNVWTAGVAWDMPPDIAGDDTPILIEKTKRHTAPSPSSRLDSFMEIASPEALQLARYLATVPLTLPVMRLVQQTMLPRSRQTHLAEVFLGGILTRADPHIPEAERETRPLFILYDFHGDIRKRLLAQLSVSEVRRTARRIAVTVEEHLGQSADFLAILADSAGDWPLDAHSLPFAKVRVAVLQRLGGRYAEQVQPLAKEVRAFEAQLEQEAKAQEQQQVQIRGEQPVSPTAFRDHFREGNTPGPEMFWLPGGSFTMGDDKSREEREKPAHEVTLGHFAIGKCPVTVGEFRRFVEATGYQTEAETGDGAYVWSKGAEKIKDANWRNPYFEQSDQHPVVCLSWNDAQAYCEWLSEQTGKEYRLLSEAQWEYACRAGTDTAYGFGENEERLGEYAWYGANSDRKTHPVGQKLPNPWGLHDLHGNVWEWVNDWYGDYPNEPQENPTGPEEGSSRVYRGGSWNSNARVCRSAYRDDWHPADRDGDLGFRLARLGTLDSYPFTLGEKPELGLCDRFPDGTPAPAMAYLPGGSFKMGSPESEKERNDWEGPVHEVSLDGFSVGHYPVTFEEYERFCKATEREVSEVEGWGRGKRPVINVSWEDGVAYCQWLSQETGARYRLLTEAEWEYACRAGSETAYCFGDDAGQLGEYAWYSGNSESKTHPVCQKKPNAWGLYDVHGNVYEWASDWFGNYSAEPQQNPKGPEAGSNRVSRGGGWDSNAGDCRSAYRFDWQPDFRDYDLGFRLARLGKPEHLYPFTLGEPEALAEAAEAEVTRGYEPGETIQDQLELGREAPEMVYLPAGTFSGCSRPKSGRMRVTN